MYALVVAWLIAPSAGARPAHDSIAPAPNERAAFVTTLGRDTVVVESITRSDTHVDGYIVVRIPGTVLCHYSADLGKDGTVTHTMLDVKPMGTSDVQSQHVTMDFDGTAARVTADAPNGQQQNAVRAFAKGGFPFYMTGFGSSYGLYSSLGMYELFLPRVVAGAKDTTGVNSIDMGTARTGTRAFVRRSPTSIDVDYFGVGWTQLTVDGDGHITAVDADRTTEKTLSHRTDFINVERMAKTFASADHDHKGLGAASPNKIAKGSIGGQAVVVTFGSPQKRGRQILGGVVQYDRVWRTGANEATNIIFAHNVAIGGNAVPAGTYSLWTIPAKDGTVQLIVNRQHGQWGTDYDPEQDMFKIPLQVATAPSPREDFAIDLTGSGNTGALRISWDTFVWTAPITAK